MATIQPTIVSTVVVSDSSGQFKVNAAQYYDATTVVLPGHVARPVGLI